MGLGAGVLFAVFFKLINGEEFFLTSTDDVFNWSLDLVWYLEYVKGGGLKKKEKKDEEELEEEVSCRSRQAEMNPTFQSGNIRQTRQRQQQEYRAMWHGTLYLLITV